MVAEDPPDARQPPAYAAPSPAGGSRECSASVEKEVGRGGGRAASVEKEVGRGGGRASSHFPPVGRRESVLRALSGEKWERIPSPLFPAHRRSLIPTSAQRGCPAAWGGGLRLSETWRTGTPPGPPKEQRTGCSRGKKTPRTLRL
ncbi:unnamed protein product [Musa textilis]